MARLTWQIKLPWMLKHVLQTRSETQIRVSLMLYGRWNLEIPKLTFPTFDLSVLQSQSQVTDHKWAPWLISCTVGQFTNQWERILGWPFGKVLTLNSNSQNFTVLWYLDLFSPLICSVRSTGICVLVEAARVDTGLLRPNVVGAVVVTAGADGAVGSTGGLFWRGSRAGLVWPALEKWRKF